MNKNNTIERNINNVILFMLVIVLILITLLYIRLSEFDINYNKDISSDQNARNYEPESTKSTNNTDTLEELNNVNLLNREEEFKNKISNIDLESKQEWYLAYKKLCMEYSDIYNYNNSLYSAFTEDELLTLFKVVQLEIGHYSFEQKANVASVIFNRLDHYKFPNNILDILTPDQFSTVDTDLFYNAVPNEEVILACEYAWEIERTNNCLFFDSNGALGNYYGLVFSDGAHNFYSLD